MSEITIERQKPEYVTIVHLSDLHFVSHGSTPRFEANPDNESNWDGLIRDIVDQRPDLVCVTGDIVDNPFSDLIKKALSESLLLRKLKGNEVEIKNWYNSLEETFTSALELLKLICSSANIDPEKSLYVIPGNHDYRIQGFFEEKSFLGNKLVAKIEQSPRSLFDIVFKRYFRSQRILFNSKAQPTSDADPIILSLVGFDSLAVDQVANFATGAISREEYEKFEFFNQKLENDALAGQPEFRVSLVHHHPLPVITTEYFRQSGKQTYGKKASKGLIKESIDVFQAEQGTLFKNAGSFLYGALRTHVDLILHGHQHHSWFTEVRYPGVVDDENRLLVAGAASIGEITNGKCKYNLIRLYRNGNITVEERSRERNPPDYKGEERLRLYTDSELRMARNTQARKRLGERYVEGYSDLKYNMAQAEQVLRRTEIQQDGSADYLATYTNLRATEEKVHWLIITGHYSQGVYTGRPIVEPIDNHYKIDIDKKQSDDNESSVWVISFSPALSKDRPVTLSIRYRIFNVFDFVEEYRRARSTRVESEELVGYAARLIIPDRLVQTVSFPEKWRPPVTPRFLVENENNKLDDDEQNYYEKSLEYIENKGVVSISIDHPIPGYWYKIKWPLDNRAKYEKNRYEPNLLNIARSLSSASLNEKEDASVAILKKLYDKFSTNLKKIPQPLFGKKTELSLFIVKYRTTGRLDQKAIETVLKRLAFLGPSDSPLINMYEHKGGSGLIGLAYRSGETQTVHQGDDMVGYEVDTLNPIVHEALWCVPLHVPSIPKIDDSASPVYAVLCAGSFENDGSLDKNSPLLREFDEYVKTEINESIYNIILGV